MWLATRFASADGSFAQITARRVISKGTVWCAAVDNHTSITDFGTTLISSNPWFADIILPPGRIVRNTHGLSTFLSQMLFSSRSPSLHFRMSQSHPGAPRKSAFQPQQVGTTCRNEEKSVASRP